jgi:hypothetical protein
MSMWDLDNSNVLIAGVESDSTSTYIELSIMMSDPKSKPDSILTKAARATLQFRRKR